MLDKSKPSHSTPLAHSSKRKETAEKRIRQELEKCKEKMKDYHDKHLRALAELENYRKRVEEERLQIAQYTKEDLICEFLPILDNFEMALYHVQNTTEPEKITEGIKLVERQVHNILKNKGLKAIEAKGKKFDPHIHEAIIQEENDKYPEGFIIEELRKGYTLGGKVIRPSQVKVTKKKKEV
jgi:molecular chaperone GrpE